VGNHLFVIFAVLDVSFAINKVIFAILDVSSPPLQTRQTSMEVFLD